MFANLACRNSNQNFSYDLKKTGRKKNKGEKEEKEKTETLKN